MLGVFQSCAVKYAFTQSILHHEAHFRRDPDQADQTVPLRQAVLARCAARAIATAGRIEAFGGLRLRTQSRKFRMCAMVPSAGDFTAISGSGQCVNSRCTLPSGYTANPSRFNFMVAR